MRSVLCFIVLCSVALTSWGQRECVSNSYLLQMQQEDRRLTSLMEEQEAFLKNRIEARKFRSGAAGQVPTSPVIRIPVVVHILYYSPSDNISDAQVYSQLAVLNADFRKLNADISRIPLKFIPYAADCQFEFVLATTDPSGNPTNGIVRKQTSIQFFGLDDRIKKSAIGGSDPWDSNSYLNIWVGNLAGGVLGYSSPIGGSRAMDGVVIKSTAFGTVGHVVAPFHKGRTATHEVGHWLGLQHIWGDTYCGDDQVGDTPPQQGASRGCPSGDISSCNNTGTMYMNFMDLTNDECMQLFTMGQRERMRTFFEDGGFRHGILVSKGLSLPAPEGVTDTETILPIDIRLAPNPARSTITITDLTGNGFQNKTFRIINQYGQAIKQFRFTGTSMDINISQLPAGMYFLETGDKRYNRRFIKS